MRRPAVQLLLGLAALAVVTGICFALGFNSTSTAFLYLIVVLVLSHVSGFVPLVLLSVCAAASLNFFFVPPRFTFTVERPLDAIELAAFLVTSLVTTRLVSRPRRAAELSVACARLLDLTHDAILVTDVHRRITYWSRSAEELFGWSADEAVGRISHELLRSRFPEPLADIDAMILTAGSWQGEVTHTTRAGRDVVVATRAVLQTAATGTPASFLVTANDVSDRVRAENDLRASEARFRTLVDHATDAFFLVDDAGVVIDVNREACESLGYTRDELIGMSPRNWDSRFDPLVYRDRFPLKQAEILTFETWHRRKDGTHFPVEVRARSFRSPDGRWLAIGLVRDITARKAAEQALRETQAALTHVTRVTTLGEVTASFAHELNQPLAAIVNNATACLGLLPDGGAPVDEVRDALRDIVADAERAAAIIERVRALARRSVAERRTVQVADVVANVLALARHESAARHVTVRADVPADLPAVAGDRVELQQVLLNLVVNAMDAMAAADTEERHVEVRARRDVDDDGHAAVTVSVADRGVGLPPDGGARLFDAFYTTKPHGMGLGLAISRSIVDAHGGRLWAEANDGRGAVFSFRLPAATTP